MRADPRPGWLTRRQGARLTALMFLTVGVALGAEPREWLERMNHALTTRNYIGVFTHNHGGRVETLRIIHRVRGRDVSERLLSLDGPGREFIRQGDELTCYFPDKRVVLVERRAPDGPLLGALPPLGGSDSHVYEIRGGERERLLGRKTRVVELQPRDEYRYGYRLWIDEETSMPLKTQLCSASGEVIEQIVFSNIDLPERIPDSMFKPQVDASNYNWQRADRQLASNSLAGPVGSHEAAGGFSHGDALGADAAGFERAGHAPGIHRWHRIGIGIRRAAEGQLQGRRRSGPGGFVVGLLHRGGWPSDHGRG